MKHIKALFFCAYATSALQLSFVSWYTVARFMIGCGGYDGRVLFLGV